MKDKKDFILRLVSTSGGALDKASDNNRKYNISHQVDMFTESNDNSILVIYFSDIDGKLFSDAINKAHPKCILDMRSNPRFNIAGYSRKIAFGEFDSLGSTYMDYVELLDGNDQSKDHLIEAAERVVKKIKQGPLVFIFGKKEHDGMYEEELMHKLPVSKEAWSLSVIP